MTKSLLANSVSDHNTAALYALMLFNAARLNTRFNMAGELIDLEEQDRNLWDKNLILLGNHYLKQSRNGQISSYHYEAAIAYLHCQSKKVETTDWQTITQLYEQLLKNEDNPFIELNYAIALYYSSEKLKAFSILHRLQKTFLNNYYILHATLGKLYLQERENIKGEHHLTKAQSLTNFRSEKDFIKRLVNRDDGDSSRSDRRQLEA